jgi:hypothetical protein
MNELDYINSIEITREKLYEMVWSETLTAISEKYYITEDRLQKICTELKIPLPRIRYWTSLKTGNIPIEKTPLGEFSGYSRTSLKLREDVVRVKELIQTHLSRIKNEIENDPKVNLKVPDKLLNPDPLIADARDRLYKKEVWSKDKGIIHDHQGSLAIFVSPNQMSRALRFMDTMIKCLRNRGHQFVSKNGHTHVVIFGEDYWISCYEKDRRVIIKDKYGSSTGLESTGKLSLRLGESYYLKEWIEGKTPMEEQVLKILAGIEYHGWKDRDERIKREKESAIREEKARIAKEIQARKEKELADFKALFKLSKRHEEAEVIRRYIQKLEDFAISKNELTDTIKEEIAWARKKADWYDPFIESDDELLIDVNREDLTMKKQSYW